MDEAFAAVMEQLRAARLARGWDLAEVARQIHITASQIAAIEEGRFQDLPGNAFTRGYLRNYARLLNLDSEEILAAYDRQVGGLGTSPSKEVLPRSEAPLLGYSHKTVIFSILLALALIAFAWWLWGENGSSTSSSTATGSSVSASSNSAPQIALSTPALPAVVSPTSIPVSSATEAAVSATPVAASASTASSSDGLEFHFSGDCWLQVRDSSGRILVSTLAKAGQVITVTQGKPPYSLLLGNVSAVQIQYHGKAVALPPKVSSVARLQVGVAPPSAPTASAQRSAVIALAQSSSGAAQSAHAHRSVGATQSAILPTANATTTHEVANATSVTHSAS